MDRHFPALAAVFAVLLFGTVWLAVLDASRPREAETRWVGANRPGQQFHVQTRTPPAASTPQLRCADEEAWALVPPPGSRASLVAAASTSRSAAVFPAADFAALSGPDILLPQSGAETPLKSGEAAEGLKQPPVVGTARSEVAEVEGQGAASRENSAHAVDGRQDVPMSQAVASPANHELVPSQPSDDAVAGGADVPVIGQDISDLEIGAQDNQGVPSDTPDSGEDAIRRNQQTLLMPSHDSSTRSRNLELAATEADGHTRKGFELAGRETYFSARAEFVNALRLLAQALDAEYRTKAHSRSLASALTALKEADDFRPAGSRMEADLDLADIVRGHCTPVLKEAAPGNLTPAGAMRCYLTFAQEQLGFAAGKEVAGSMALHGLGKLHSVVAEKQSTTIKGAMQKAMVFYQSSLLVYPQNYMASNDLGVLLAKSGRYEDARTALEHSLSIRRQSDGWHNLAVVYRRLGRTDSARRADLLAESDRRAEAAQVAGGSRPASGQVEWVDPYTFARAQGQTLPNRQPVSVASPSTGYGEVQPYWPTKQRVAQAWQYNPR